MNDYRFLRRAALRDGDSPHTGLSYGHGFDLNGRYVVMTSDVFRCHLVWNPVNLPMVNDLLPFSFSEPDADIQKARKPLASVSTLLEKRQTNNLFATAGDIRNGLRATHRWELGFFAVQCGNRLYFATTRHTAFVSKVTGPPKWRVLFTLSHRYVRDALLPYEDSHIVHILYSDETQSPVLIGKLGTRAALIMQMHVDAAPKPVTMLLQQRPHRTMQGLTSRVKMKKLLNSQCESESE